MREPWTDRLRMTTGPNDKLRLQAALQSAEAWRDLVLLGADLAFETDAERRFCMLAPDPVLGWPAATLLGSAADSLLAEADPAVSDPFRASMPARRQPVWLRNADGSTRCLLLSVAPIAGRPGCVRGLGIDLSMLPAAGGARAEPLGQRELTRSIARRMRAAALPFASLAIALGELQDAIGARGAALMLHDPPAALRVAARAGQAWPGPVQALQDAVLSRCAEAPAWLRERSRQSVLCGQSLLLCDSTNHFIDRAILAVWRDHAPWTARETALVASLLALIQPVLEHEQIQRETARQSRADILTGLFNRRGFAAELPRRFERLDREGLPATLLVLGLDGLGSINSRFGLQAGDAALRHAASALCGGVRPTDLVGRLGGDLFALWLDGADQFAAAERADALGRAGIVAQQQPGVRIGISIGLAVRSSRSFESIESLLHRAWSAMRRVKLAGGGGWQVSTAEPTP